PLGTHTITANYTSNGTVFANSSSTPLMQTVASVTPSPYTTLFRSNSFPGESVTFTATVSASEGGTPTGSVTFKIDGGGATVVSLNGAGQATFTTSTVGLGTHTITANYKNSGGNFVDSSATPLRQTV